MRALQITSLRLTGLRRTEQDRKPDMLGRVIGGAENPPGDLGQQLHSLTTTRTGTDKDQLANGIGCLQGDLLATMPPIEKPSTWALQPSARLKATAFALIWSNVVGTSPELLETPALSTITSTIGSTFVAAGSQ